MHSQPLLGEGCWLISFRRDVDVDLLTVKVLDEDRIGSDDLIGICRIGVAALANGEPHEMSLPVRGSNEHSRLHITATFAPLTGASTLYLRGHRPKDPAQEQQAHDVRVLQNCSSAPSSESTSYNACPDELAAEVARAEMGPAPEGSPLTRMPDAWRKLAAVAGHTAEDLFDPVAFVENLRTDTQARAKLLQPEEVSTQACCHAVYQRLVTCCRIEAGSVRDQRQGCVFSRAFYLHASCTLGQPLFLTILHNP